MNFSHTTHLPAVRTAPLFTLGSALRWLGHDCRCSQPIDTLPASMWFLRRGHPLPMYPPQAVLVVDLAETGGPLARIHRLIDKVDRCTRGETIRVRQRHSSDNGHNLIALKMNRTPLVWRPGTGRKQNVGRFEITVQDLGVVSHREGLQRVSQDRTNLRHLRMVR